MGLKLHTIPAVKLREAFNYQYFGSHFYIICFTKKQTLSKTNLYEYVNKF